MCGIAGYFNKTGAAQSSIVKAMCDSIRHRGPDDEGFHLDGGCAIGMRRLSIIDLSSGHQPISNEDGSIWIVFNGEIYNYLELRESLLQKGHRFSTNTDTEVIVHLYEEMGEKCVSLLRGMFAFCIWDAPRKSLFLARDRFGKKPLYYSAIPEGFVFGSEIKCLIAAGVPLEIDSEALRLYLLLTYIPDPMSAYRAIRKLEAGHWLRYDTTTGTTGSGAYWKAPVPAGAVSAGLDESAVLERLRNEFDQAVRARMIADVPLGAFLSGGLDSSSVVASMARQSPEPVKTFSIGFEEPEFSELDLARLVAQQYKTDHHEIVVKPEAVSLIERLVDHFDEPFGDSSAIPTFIVSEFAAQYVKVALTGDGGDELFGGYRTLQNARGSAWMDTIPAALRRGIGGIADLLPYSAYGKNFLRMMSRRTPFERYFDREYWPFYLGEQLLQPRWRSPRDTEFLNSVLGRYRLDEAEDILTQIMFFDETANLAGDMLVKVDRMSMANSLEVRCPLLDHHLAEFAAELPMAWKVQNGIGKAVFRKALGARLPAALLTAQKKGFSVPLAAWFRGPLKEFVRQHLCSARFLERGIVNPRFLDQMLAEHDSGRRDNYPYIWRLLILELWFRQEESRSPASGPFGGT